MGLVPLELSPLLLRVCLFACDATMELISDKSGSIAFGWLTADVHYARVTGDISPHLATTLLKGAELTLPHRAPIHFFADCVEVKTIDLLARSAFARFLLAHRKRFAEMVVLASEPVPTAAQAFATSVGEPFALLANPSDFTKRLNSIVPGFSQLVAPPPKTDARKEQATSVPAKSGRAEHR